MPSLDVPEKQVLVYYATDPIHWHQRILLQRVEGSTWIWVTPTGEVQTANLSQVEGVRSLPRNTTFPRGIGRIYRFPAVDPVTLDWYRAAARHLSEVLGGASSSIDHVIPDAV